MKMFNSGLTTIGLLLAAACSNGTDDAAEPATTPDQSLMRVVNGEVIYRERMLIPDGATVTVTLEDQSRADAPATIITNYTHTVSGPPPYPFRLVYNPAAIDDRMRYGLRAKIEMDGTLMFTSTEYLDPFATPGEPVEIVVQRVGR